jgi:Ca2+-binding EF-hand superfamily protein
VITAVRIILGRIVAQVRAMRVRKSPFVACVSLVGSLLIIIPAIALTQFPAQRDAAGPLPKKGPPKANPSEAPGKSPKGGKVGDLSDRVLPYGLPAWFKDLDADEEGQVSFHQWRAGGKGLEEFRKYDLNHDGFITAEEVMRYLNKPIELKAKKGQASYEGAIEESDEGFQNKKHAKIFIVKLEKNKTYQFDHKSKVFDAYLYLEDPDGVIVAEDDDSGGGLDARIVHRAAKTGVYRLIATGLGGFRGGAFSFSMRVTSSYTLDLPKGLPSWFTDLDQNEDGQISLHEWRAAGKPLDQFRAYDLNDDGFITPEEVFRYMNNPIEPAPESGLATLKDTIEVAAEIYRGKRAYKILTVKLEADATYQIDNVSQVYYAFTYLEDPDGELLAQHDSGGNGKTARIVYHASKTGNYRLVITSLAGVRTGEFSLSVKILRRSSSALPKGLPAWFKQLDTDGDGQVALHEWRAAGKNLDEFHRYDLNGDGFITVEEMQRCMKKPIELAAAEPQATFDYAIETATDGAHRGKRAYKFLSINLEEGKTYQFDCQSKAFQAFLYLEDGAGNVLAENSSPNVGGNSRIVFRAAASGTYRIVATSLGGYRIGDFSFSVRRKDGN